MLLLYWPELNDMTNSGRWSSEDENICTRLVSTTKLRLLVRKKRKLKCVEKLAVSTRRWIGFTLARMNNRMGKDCSREERQKTRVKY